MNTLNVLWPILLIGLVHGIKDNYIKAPNRILENESIVIGSGNITSLPSTDMYENSASFGLMFDVIAIKPLTITEFHFYTRAADEVKYLLYTVQGEYANSKHNLNLWTLIASGTANSHGTEKPTRISRLRSMSIPAGATQGFYITLQTENLIYLSTTLELGDRMKWNEDVAVSIGTGVASYPLDGNFFEPRNFCGLVSYYVMGESSSSPDVLPSSMEPTSMPTLSPSSTKPTSMPTTSPTSYSTFESTFIDISNSTHNQSISNYTSITQTTSPTYYTTTTTSQKFKTIFSNQTIILIGLNKNINEMNTQSSEIFIKELKTSLQEYLSKEYGIIKIKNISINDQSIIKESYNEIVTYIETETSIIDISNILQEALTEMRQSILINLKRNDVYFQNIKKIFFDSTPKLDFEEVFEAMSVNESLSLRYTKGSNKELDYFSEIKLEDEIRNFLDMELLDRNESSYLVLSHITHHNFAQDCLNVDIIIEVKYLSSIEDFDIGSSIQEILTDENQRLYYQLKDTNLPIFDDLVSVDYVVSTATTEPAMDIEDYTIKPTSAPQENDSTLENDEENDTKTFSFNLDSTKKFFTTTTGYITAGASGFLFILVITIIVSCCCCKNSCMKCCCCGKNERDRYDRYEGMVIETKPNVVLDDPTLAMSGVSGGSTVQGRRPSDEKENRRQFIMNSYLMQNLTPGYFTSKRKVVRF